VGDQARNKKIGVPDILGKRFEKVKEYKNKKIKAQKN
jgi:hypothetical protein